MQRFRTLRARTALWTASLLFCVLALFGVFIYASLADGLSGALDESLQLVASQVVAGLDIEGDRLIHSDTFATEPENVDFRARGFTVRVSTAEGETLYAFGQADALPPARLDATERRAFETLDGGAGRMITVPVEAGTRRLALVQVAQSTAGVQDVLDRLLVTLAISVPGLAVVAAGLGYFLAVRALDPIDQITRRARRISAADLSTRLDLPPTDDEVGRLAQTLNAMLARLDDSFRRERQFTSDASHELRTPLTAMQTILATMSARPRTVDDYQQALGDLSEETERLQVLTDSLLELARAQTDALPAFEAVDLSALLRDITDALLPLAAAKDLTLHADLPDGLVLEGDRDALLRLFVNLVDNAIKYTERGGVTVEAARDAGAIVVRVADTGIGIPREHLARVFDRFYRADPSRALPGAGLGLAIARTIALAHSGQIEAGSAPGGGALFTVRLPERVTRRRGDTVPGRTSHL
mgnify:CR=1 FL=1